MTGQHVDYKLREIVSWLCSCIVLRATHVLFAAHLGVI